MGWAGLGKQALPKNVFKIDYAPYEWLLPKTSLIIHHGGSGTTAFGLRSGVPSVVVPFVFDQFYWGKRIMELGAGPVTVPFRKLNVKRLRDMILSGVGNLQMQEKAKEIADKIRSENGIQNAVDVIRNILIKKITAN